MGNRQHRYATNSIISERYNVNKVVDAEIESLKFQPKIQHKYKRNVYIQKFDEGNKPIQVDFLHNDGKLKSHIYYNEQGQPIREIYRSNYGIGDYTAISDFIYDEEGKLKKVKTKIDDGAEFVQEY